MLKSSQSSNILEKSFNSLESSKLLQSIRGGLVMLIPILLIGSFSQLLLSLPIPAYQDFKDSLWDGMLNDILSFANTATVGILAVYVTMSISLCHSRQYLSAKFFNYGPMITSLISFFIFSGFLQQGFNKDYLGTGGMFTAIICGLGASSLYCAFDKWINRHLMYKLHIYSDGADEEFNHAMAMIFPSCMVVICVVFLYYLFIKCFDVTSFQMLFSNWIIKLFKNTGRSLGTMLLFSVFASVLWFFGLHGNNILAPVSQHLFESSVGFNNQLILTGGSSDIYTQTFYDVFSLMGGTGNAISLLIAILIFGKRRSNRKLAKCSIFPMFFNISETITFGLPIVFNPIMFIPFVLTPIALICVSSLAITLGLVPIPTMKVAWTTPMLLGGYMATGSIAGSILQVVNIFIGVLIYCPFVRIYDEVKEKNAKYRMDKLVNIIQQSEAENKPIELLSMRDNIGETAKSLAEDLQHYLDHQLPVLHYQPQYDHSGRCIGAEALLRWKHPVYGNIFPPLIMKLAEEIDLLTTLEKNIFKVVIQDLDVLLKNLDDDAHISVNITGVTIQTGEFEEFLKELQTIHPKKVSRICLEITEQAAINLDQTLIERLTRIRKMGYSLAIDDFSMGNTSIKYLQTSVFNLVKLDGALIQNMITNPRSREIIASITNLSSKFDIQVLAEFVETEVQKKVLEENGCLLYQGYLYSPAVTVDEFANTIKKIQIRLSKHNKL